MSDLVDRLRALPWHEPAIAEAADEIERLRGDLEVMRLQRDATQSSRCPTCERLRAALRPFAQDDLRLRLGGNSPREGDSAVIFQRNSAILRLRDFDRAKTALQDKDDEKV